MARESLPVVHYLTDERLADSQLGEIVEGVYEQLGSFRYVRTAADGMTDLDLLRARPDIVTKPIRYQTLLHAESLGINDPNAVDLTTRQARKIYVETYQQHGMLRCIFDTLDLDSLSREDREGVVHSAFMTPAFYRSPSGIAAMSLTTALSLEPLEIAALTSTERHYFEGRDEYIESIVRQRAELTPQQRVAAMVSWLTVPQL